MGLFDAITLMGVMLILAALPSASVALVVARAATHGISNGIAVAVGIIMGDLVFIALAILGLTTLSQALGGFFILIKIAGGGYLIWLGIQLWRSSGTQPSISISQRDHPDGHLTSFVAGFLLTLGDIKAILFYASLFPLFVNLQSVSMLDIVVVVSITVVSIGAVKITYAVFAQRLSQHFEQRRLTRLQQKTTAGILIGAGGYVVFKP